MEQKNVEVAEYKQKAIRLLSQVEIGILDFENDDSLIDFLERNYFGPVFIPVIKRKNKKERFDLVKQEFLEKFGIEVSADKYIVLRMESKLLGSAPYVAFRRPN